VHRELQEPVDIEKTLKMILTHDLVEAETGDVPFFERSELKRRKAARERAAIERVRAQLGGPVGWEILELWYEYEAKESAEAKLATALDHLEVQIQHNLADLKT
jgi:5'-deoxynucleotidase YfbR-like HD superfamily hydrolase